MFGLWAFLAACPCALLSAILYAYSLIGRVKMLACFALLCEWSVLACRTVIVVNCTVYRGR